MMTVSAQPANPAPDGDEGRASAQGQPASIQVALTTYNSEAFLPDLLESLFTQTHQNFTLIVADDGSADGTLEILDRYAAKLPGRIRIVRAGPQRLGALGNFARLIDVVDADYMLLCDHDDIWLPNKIALSLERIQALEARHSPNTPLLVHTDLIVVGSDLQVLAPSFFRYSGIDPARNDFCRLLTGNVVTGCASIVNRALYERARPIPPEATMYDHWLALVASLFGAISFLAEPTILYRQHPGNVIGAQRAGTASMFHRIRQTLFSDKNVRLMERYSRQAGLLLARYRDAMTLEQRRAAEALAALWSTSRWRRFGVLRRSGLGMRGFVRNAALMVVVTRGPRRDPDA